jgi:hypothetical protein
MQASATDHADAAAVGLPAASTVENPHRQSSNRRSGRVAATSALAVAGSRARSAPAPLAGLCQRSPHRGRAGRLAPKRGTWRPLRFGGWGRTDRRPARHGIQAPPGGQPDHPHVCGLRPGLASSPQIDPECARAPCPPCLPRHHQRNCLHPPCTVLPCAGARLRTLVVERPTRPVQVLATLRKMVEDRPLSVSGACRRLEGQPRQRRCFP